MSCTTYREETLKRQREEVSGLQHGISSQILLCSSSCLRLDGLRIGECWNLPVQVWLVRSGLSGLFPVLAVQGK